MISNFISLIGCVIYNSASEVSEDLECEADLQIKPRESNMEKSKDAIEMNCDVDTKKLDSRQEKVENYKETDTDLNYIDTKKRDSGKKRAPKNYHVDDCHQEPPEVKKTFLDAAFETYCKAKEAEAEVENYKESGFWKKIKIILEKGKPQKILMYHLEQDKRY